MIGKILGGLVSITGIILLAFPISVIVETFNEEYTERERRGAKAQDDEDGDEDDEEATRPSVLQVSAEVVAQDLCKSLRLIDGRLYWELNQKPGAAMKRRGKFF